MGEQKKRDDGIEILRLLSMFMIVVLHVLSQGSVMVRYSYMPRTYDVSWLLESFAFCAVNCYGLISGYVGVKTKWHPGRFLKMYATVWFYSAGLTLVLGIFGAGSVIPEIFMQSVFPISAKAYWYVSCYGVLFFCMPFLNTLLLRLNDAKRRMLFHGVLWILCAGTMIPKALGVDFLVLLGGYSLIWLAALYLCGGCLALTPPRKMYARGVYVLAYAVLSLTSWLFKIGMEQVTRALFGEARYARMLLTYTSPTIFLAGVCLLLAFKDIYLPEGKARRILHVLSGSAFCVYLIHTQPMVWRYILKGAFRSYSKLRAGLVAWPVLGSALLIWAVCLLLDQPRAALFRRLRMDMRCKRAGAALGMYFNRYFADEDN